MTRDEIYEHLAKVYLGKRESIQQKKKKPISSWLVVNIVITVAILASTIYGFTAFLTRRPVALRNRVIYALNNSPIRLSYDFHESFPKSQMFSMEVPQMDASKYTKLRFSIRALNEGKPGIVKLFIQNSRRERAEYFVKDVESQWQTIAVPLSQFNISDWSELTDLGFVLEGWNIPQKKGTILIDDISFSN